MANVKWLPVYYEVINIDLKNHDYSMPELRVLMDRSQKIKGK